MNYSKNQANEKIQTNMRKNRRLFQITQTRTQHETNTQIYTKISQKNSIFKCIFRIINHITRILLKNSHTTIIRKLKNSNP